MLDHCLELLASQSSLVLATAGEDGPHTSLMAYVSSADGREIHMVTRDDTRKWANLAVSPQVSLLVDDRAGSRPSGETRALTITGRVQRLDGEAERTILNTIAARHPHLAEITSAPNARAVVVKTGSFLLLSGPTQAFYHSFDV